MRTPELSASAARNSPKRQRALSACQSSTVMA
jgi:hypothetical protein